MTNMFKWLRFAKMVTDGCQTLTPRQNGVPGKGLGLRHFSVHKNLTCTWDCLICVLEASVLFVQFNTAFHD